MTSDYAPTPVEDFLDPDDPILFPRLTPEQVEGRDPQQGAYLHTGPETLFEEFGFTRDRQIAKWRWVMRLRVDV